MSLQKPQRCNRVEGASRHAAARPVSRRFFGFVLAGAALGTLAGCNAHQAWHNTDISGAMPNLAFTMTRATDGQKVTAANYLGKVVLLYFGYTNCPDICPTTMATAAEIFKKLKGKADQARFLFVTVDPNRDTLDVLKKYTAAFGPQFVGLRGTPDELTALARRYRVSYSVTPATKGRPYEVTHSSAIYVFDKKGAVRLLLTLSGKKPDIDGSAADLARLID